MAESDNHLVGAWRKDADTPCATRYPVHLRLESNGLYVGTTDPPGAFTWWDGGVWRVTTPGRLALSVANDAVIEYAYELQGDVLRITDAGGCQFSYRRNT